VFVRSIQPETGREMSSRPAFFFAGFLQNFAGKAAAGKNF
jgi:hypothetical protein